MREPNLMNTFIVLLTICNPFCEYTSLNIVNFHILNSHTYYILTIHINHVN